MSEEKYSIYTEVDTGHGRIETRVCQQLLLNAVRSHWQVESMHWMLDMTFREDESRIRKKRGPLVINVIRKIAMALFKQDTTKSASMARKKKMAGLDDNYRSTLLESGIKMR